MLIGIGAGNPDYITVQAINALKQVDVIFVTNKGEDSADLLRARKDVCERYMRAKPYRMVEIQDPKRDRCTGAYQERSPRGMTSARRCMSKSLKNSSPTMNAVHFSFGRPLCTTAPCGSLDQVATLKSVDFGGRSFASLAFRRSRHATEFL
jgi:precorrin-6A synthase